MPVSGIAKKDASKLRAYHTQRSSDLEPLMILTVTAAYLQEKQRK